MTQSGLERYEHSYWLRLPKVADQDRGEAEQPKQIVWHWPSHKLKRKLRLRVAGGGWQPSAPIDIFCEPGEAIDVVKSRPDATRGADEVRQPELFSIPRQEATWHRGRLLCIRNARPWLTMHLT